MAKAAKSKAGGFDEEKWKAEEDARTLAAAHAITKDPERLKRAQEAAKDLKEDMREHADHAKDSADAMDALASKMYPTMRGT
jgi:cobalamin biosynthesis protein CbiD